ncbi:lipopolysaccharide kinase InaA family protein [Namhaeicola litoreus]|uniref:Lipopolysaccharide kinase InaA family protein n=1 Tax=Namhaeicola litoreus TaxID=1052145 RepID=A0ABW3Y3M1_9FLAO
MAYTYFISEPFRAYQKQFSKLISDFENQGKVIYDGSRNTVKEIEIAGNNLNVKAFKVPHFINQLAYRWVRKSKAKRSFEHAETLLSKDIGTPKPVAYVENKEGLFLKDSYYFSQQLTYNLTYRTLIDEPHYPDHERILREFTRFTFKMHEKEVLFKDHSPGNTLIVNQSGRYEFYLVDLNRMEFRKLTFEERMKNFDRLTPKKEMVEIMSDEYAKLSGNTYQIVFDKMWQYTSEFREKYNRKKALKKKYLGK